MYISPSNIIETGYTSGGQFVISSIQKVYIGHYHKDKFGKYWTGETHTENSELLDNLLPTISSTDNNKPISFYSTLNPINIPSVKIKSDVIIPTKDDYKKGYFTRYILSCNNSSIPTFIEVNPSNFKNIIQIPNIAVLYLATSLIWKLTGPKNDIYKNNIRIEAGIEDTNKRSIAEANKTLPNISLYLTDPLQFGKLN